MFQRKKPAILGGPPVFESLIPLAQPVLPQAKSLVKQLECAFSRGQISSYGKYAQELEDKIKTYTGARHVLAVTNATTGLILALKALNLRGEVIVPSFTFSAAVHSLRWCNLEPVFCDISATTFNIEKQNILSLINENTSAILAHNCFGVPCDIEGLTQIARDYKLPLLFDSASALGSQYNNAPLGGFGSAEIFSTSASKVFTTGEGGFICTNSDYLGEQLHILRNYGNSPSFKNSSIGLNGKMSELTAILGLNTLESLNTFVSNRNKNALLYRKLLTSIDGIRFQEVPVNCLSTYKDFAIILDNALFGLSRDLLAKALESENIQVKAYFYPPLHRHPDYEKFTFKDCADLNITDSISASVLSLPMFSEEANETIECICEALWNIKVHADEITCDAINAHR